MQICNAFTVDVEDYYHVSNFEKHIDRADWGQHESRVEANTRRVLKLLEKHGVRATFFVLGWVAERFPHLVREIRAGGHEIGSHGYWHRLIYSLSPEQFRDDLVKTRKILEDISEGPVTAYRAPSFSITKRSLWALEILVEEGIRFDSSIFPVRHHRYGIPAADPAIHRIDTAAGPLWEFPVSVLRIGGVNLPVSGGGYFRLYPLKWSLYFLSRINRKHARPFVFFIHPWELDPDQPRLHVGSPIARARHYLNLGSTEEKLTAVLERFRFGRMCDVVREVDPGAVISPPSGKPDSDRPGSP